MRNNLETVIVRFPPSPTGLLQMGNIRTALYNYLFAKHHGGKFLLRIEDTDKERSKKEYEDAIYDDLNWLGLQHDGEVLKSSQRTEIYKKLLQKLISENKAYISQETEGENREVVRFKNPGGKIKFHDLIRGEVEVDVTDLKDFIIARNINDPVYHFAVSVDDMESGITHIIRGDDHISNTPRQIMIIEALGGSRPTYAHIPLVLAEDKSKLSKRKHGESVSLKYYRDKGYLPEAILNFLALIGWNPGTDQEVFTLEELIAKFDLKKVQKSGGVFNPEKLDWLNKEHLKKLPEEERDKKIKEKIGNKIPEEIQQKVYPIIFDRINKWSDIDTLVEAGELDYFMNPPQYDKNLLLWKGQSADTAVKHLEWVMNALKNSEDFSDVEKIKSLIFDYATEHGRGEVLWPVRVALSGKEKSPDPFTLIYVLGKEESLRRLQTALDMLKA